MPLDFAAIDEDLNRSGQGGGNVEQWRPLVKRYFPADQVDNALRVMEGESGGDPQSFNRNTDGTTDHGLFQINSSHTEDSVGAKREDWTKPETNVAIAANLYKAQGWKPWVAARKLGLVGGDPGNGRQSLSSRGGLDFAAIDRDMNRPKPKPSVPTYSTAWITAPHPEPATTAEALKGLTLSPSQRMAGNLHPEWDIKHEVTPTGKIVAAKPRPAKPSKKGKVASAPTEVQTPAWLESFAAKDEQFPDEDRQRWLDHVILDKVSGGNVNSSATADNLTPQQLQGLAKTGKFSSGDIRYMSEASGQGYRFSGTFTKGTSIPDAAIEGVLIALGGGAAGPKAANLVVKGAVSMPVITAAFRAVNPESWRDPGRAFGEWFANMPDDFMVGAKWALAGEGMGSLLAAGVSKSKAVSAGYNAVKQVVRGVSRMGGVKGRAARTLLEMGKTYTEIPVLNAIVNPTEFTKDPAGYLKSQYFSNAGLVNAAFGGVMHNLPVIGGETQLQRGIKARDEAVLSRFGKEGVQAPTAEEMDAAARRRQTAAGLSDPYGLRAPIFRVNTPNDTRVGKLVKQFADGVTLEFADGHREMFRSDTVAQAEPGSPITAGRFAPGATVEDVAATATPLSEAEGADLAANVGNIDALMGKGGTAEAAPAGKEPAAEPTELWQSDWADFKANDPVRRAVEESEHTAWAFGEDSPQAQAAEARLKALVPEERGGGWTSVATGGTTLWFESIRNAVLDGKLSPSEAGKRLRTAPEEVQNAKAIADIESLPDRTTSAPAPRPDLGHVTVTALEFLESHKNEPIAFGDILRGVQEQLPEANAGDVVAALGKAQLEYPGSVQSLRYGLWLFNAPGEIPGKARLPDQGAMLEGGAGEPATTYDAYTGAARPGAGGEAAPYSGVPITPKESTPKPKTPQPMMNEYSPEDEVALNQAILAQEDRNQFADLLAWKPKNGGKGARYRVVGPWNQSLSPYPHVYEVAEIANLAGMDTNEFHDWANEVLKSQEEYSVIDRHTGRAREGGELEDTITSWEINRLKDYIKRPTLFEAERAQNIAMRRKTRERKPSKQESVKSMKARARAEKAAMQTEGGQSQQAPVEPVTPPPTEATPTVAGGIIPPLNEERLPAGKTPQSEPASAAGQGAGSTADYRGLHEAPAADSGSPLHDLSGTYPEDFYGPKAAEYYGHYGQAHPMDRESVALVQSLRDKPNASVKIYRAVPEILTNEQQIARYEAQKAYILKNGKLPPGAEEPSMSRSDYYDLISNRIEHLKTAPPANVPDMQINRGDWVTINRAYAKEHGEAQFGKDYKILSKTVKAKDVFTNGDSIHEWGYDPQETSNPNPSAPGGSGASESSPPPVEAPQAPQEAAKQAWEQPLHEFRDPSLVLSESADKTISALGKRQDEIALELADRQGIDHLPEAVNTARQSPDVTIQNLVKEYDVITKKVEDAYIADRHGYGHKIAVERALAEGKPVPPEVLADYPDLVKQQPAPPAEGGQSQQAPVEPVTPPPTEATPESNWREAFDVTTDPSRKTDILRSAANGKSTDAELGDILNRVNRGLPDEAHILSDVAQNAAASESTKARALELRDQATRPGAHPPSAEDIALGAGEPPPVEAPQAPQEAAKQPLDVARQILRDNPLHYNEADYYAGRTGKNPQGIPDAIWQEAWKLEQDNIRVHPPIEKGMVEGTSKPLADYPDLAAKQQPAPPAEGAVTASTGEAEPQAEQPVTEPVVSADSFRSALTATGRFSPDHVDAITALTEANRKVTGESEADYYGKRFAEITGGGEIGEGALRQQLAPIFYSKLSRVVAEKMGGKMRVDELRRMLEANGAKPDEMKWTGFDDWLDSQKSGAVTKDAVQQFLLENQVQVREVVKGESSNALYDKQNALMSEMHSKYGDGWRLKATPEENRAVDDLGRRAEEAGSGTKFDAYQLPGGENYRELLLTLPDSAAARLSEIERQMNDIAARPASEHAKHPEWQVEWDKLSVERLNTQSEQSRGQYRSAHWDEPNVLAHVRFNDRTGPNGEKILHVEEVQSDWHQAGREKGYKDSGRIAEAAKKVSDIEAEKRALTQSWLPPGEWRAERFINDNGGSDYHVFKGDKFIMDTGDRGKAEAIGRVQKLFFDGMEAAGQNIPQYREVQERLLQAQRDLSNLQYQGVPPAPFSKTWPELAFKRIIRYAAENGYDRITWTTGEQQAERYDLSKQVTSIEVVPRTDANTGEKTRAVTLNLSGNTIPSYVEMGIDRNGLIDNSTQADFKGKKLEDVVGKEIAQRIMQGNHQTLEGEGLKVGGTGMKAFYDEILPATVNKLVKKWGGKVGETSIASGEVADVRSVHEPTQATREGITDPAKQYRVWGPRPGRVSGPITGWMTEAEALKVATENQPQSTVHSLDITPDMKSAVLEQGQPLFQRESPTLYGPKWFNNVRDAIIAGTGRRWGWDFVGDKPITGRQLADAVRESGGPSDVSVSLPAIMDQSRALTALSDILESDPQWVEKMRQERLKSRVWDVAGADTLRLEWRDGKWRVYDARTEFVLAQSADRLDALQKAYKVQVAGAKKLGADRPMWSPNKADALLLQSVNDSIKGSTEFTADSRAVMRFFESADISTGVHEVAHVFRRNLSADENTILERAFKVKNGKWQAMHEERFARGFERYLRDGHAPTEELRGVFAKFKEWLTNIYQSLKGTPLAERIPAEVKGVYDRMLGGETPAEKGTGEVKSQAKNRRLPGNTFMDMTDAEYEAYKKAHPATSNTPRTRLHNLKVGAKVSDITLKSALKGFRSQNKGVKLTIIERPKLVEYPTGHREYSGILRLEREGYQTADFELTIQDNGSWAAQRKRNLVVGPATPAPESRAVEGAGAVPEAKVVTPPVARSLGKGKIIPSDPSLKIVNIEHLARGTGARYLLTMEGEDGALVASAWKRKLPMTLKAGEVLVDLEAGRQAREKATPAFGAPKPAEAKALSAEAAQPRIPETTDTFGLARPKVVTPEAEKPAKPAPYTEPKYGKPTGQIDIEGKPVVTPGLEFGNAPETPKQVEAKRVARERQLYAEANPQAAAEIARLKEELQKAHDESPSLFDTLKSEEGSADPAHWAKLLEYGTLKAHEAAWNVDEWRKRVVAELGDWIEPMLERVWKAIEGSRPVEGAPQPASKEHPNLEYTGAAKAFTEAEREVRGQSPVDMQHYVTVEEAWNRGQAEVTSGRIEPRSLAKERARHPKTPTPEEVGAFVYDRRRLNNELMDVVKRVKGATDPTVINDGRVQIARVIGDLSDNEEALRRGGREASAALQSFKQVVKSDYTLATGILKRAVREGKSASDVTEAERAKIVEMSDRIAYLERQIVERDERIKAREEEVKRVVGKAKEQVGQVSREQYADIRARLQSKMAGRLHMGVDPTIASDLAEILAYHLQDKAQSLKELKRIVKTDIPGVTDAEIAAGYNKLRTEGRLPTGGAKSKPMIEYDTEAVGLRDQLSKARMRYDDYVNPRLKQSRWQRAFGAMEGVYRESILSGPSVFSKLFGATAGNWPTETLADVFGIIPDHVLSIGGKHIGDLGSGKVSLASIMRGTKALISRKAVSDSWETLMTGGNEMTRMLGYSTKKWELGGMFGRVHGAEKAFLQRAHFEKSMYQRLAHADRIGLDISDERVQESAMYGAAYDAWEQILQGDNKADTFITKVINAGRKTDASLGFFLKTLFPVVKVPMNYLGRTVQMTGAGIPEGFYRWGKAAWKVRGARPSEGELDLNIKDMPTVEEIDKMRKAFKYGGVGLVAAYLGLAQPKWFRSSGFFNRDESNPDADGKPMEPDSVQLFGVHVPRIFTHTPFLNAVQFYATIGRQARGKDTKDREAVQVAGEAAGGLADQVPGAISWSRLASPYITHGQRVGRYVSQFEPQLIKQWAAWADKDSVDNPRKPRDLSDELKVGVPGLRQQVPLKWGFAVFIPKDRRQGVMDELHRLQESRTPDEPSVFPSNPDHKLKIDGKSVQMTRQEYQTYEKRRSAALGKAIAADMQKPDYRKLDDPSKREWLNSLIEDTAADERETWRNMLEKKRKAEVGK